MKRTMVGLLLAGCVDQVDELGETEQSGVIENGVSLNGVSLNGVSLNGVSLNGVSLNGVSLNGVSLNGVSLNGVSLNGVSLNGVSLNGVSLDGTTLADLVGSTWTGLLSNGTSIAIRIDSATQGTGDNSDIGMYAFSYETIDGWQPMCLADDGTPALALAVPGTWNLNFGSPGGGSYQPGSEFTIACRLRTVAKCVELGYKPWRDRTPQLASCVRMLRGDYCGDGTPYTQNGLFVNLYDNLGIQLDTEDWMIEAEWTPAGARCISRANETRLFNTGRSVPPCIQWHSLPTSPMCGANFEFGAVIIDEIPSPKK